MTDRQQSHRWNTAPELPLAALTVLQRPYSENYPTAIVATVDSDGFPHTAPFGSVRAIAPGLIRFACDRRHDTYTNLRRDGRMVISVVAPPNIAVSIRGRATVVKEQMELSSEDAIVELQVQEVKNDILPGSDIRSTITISATHELLEFLRKYIAEIESVKLP